MNNLGTRLGQPVAGVAHKIGDGFTAQHFSKAMFGDSMSPLLMVDHFVMTSPTFAPHVHNGISAVTVMFEDSQGKFLNRDTLGHDIALKGGDLYWLAAASGAAHEERPEDGARTHALQIFVDMPESLKRKPACAFHVRAEDVPVIQHRSARVRVVLGRSGQVAGAEDTPQDTTMLDGFLESGGQFAHRLPADWQAWIYALSGSLVAACEGAQHTLDAGSAIAVRAGAESDITLVSGTASHFVLIAGRPIVQALQKRKPRTTVFPIDAAEREREQALRGHFARFWQSAQGTPRETYDAFISASPLASDIALEEVDEAGVRGWWVRPARSKPKQAMLYIHGGGYVLGKAEAYRGFVSQLASRTQLPALAIDYPLAPEASLPSAPHTALNAWRWLVSQGFEQIAIVGDSAGGGLSLVTLEQLATLNEGPQPIAGVVFSPWTDLAFTGASMKDPAVVDPLIGYDYLQDCARKYLGTANAFNPLASPLFGTLQGLPPLLIQAGTDERLLDDSRQFAVKAALAGVPVELEIWEGMHHVFQLDVAHIESSRKALDRAARFLIHAFQHGEQK